MFERVPRGGVLNRLEFVWWLDLLARLVGFLFGWRIVSFRSDGGYELPNAY